MGAREVKRLRDAATVASAAIGVAGASPTKGCKCIPWDSSTLHVIPGYKPPSKSAAKTAKCLRIELDQSLVLSPFDSKLTEQDFIANANRTRLHHEAGAMSAMGGCWCAATASSLRPTFEKCECDGQIVYEGKVRNTFQHSGVPITAQTTALIRQNLLQMFRELTELLRRHEIRYVVVSGTLMGYASTLVGLVLRC